MSGRSAILNDLSPAAVHIARNYCTPVDVDALRAEFDGSRLLSRRNSSGCTAPRATDAAVRPQLSTPFGAMCSNVDVAVRN